MSDELVYLANNLDLRDGPTLLFLNKVITLGSSLLSGIMAVGTAPRTCPMHY